MIELIPNLLVDQVAKPLDINHLSAEVTQLVAKQVKALPLTKTAIAAPETLPIQLLPTALVATAHLGAPDTATDAAIVPPSDAEDLLAGRQADASQADASQASDSSEGADSTQAEGAESAAPPAVSPSPAPPVPAPPAPIPPVASNPPAAPVAAPVAVAPATVSVQPIPTAPPAASSAIASQSNAPAASPLPAGDQIAAAPNRATGETAIAERKKVIEQRLAEIVAKDRQLKTAQQETALVTNAIAAAQQGNFDQARTILSDPAIPAAVQTEVMSRIAALQLADVPSLPQLQPQPAVAPQPQQVLIPVPPSVQPALNQLPKPEAQQMPGSLNPPPTWKAPVAAEDGLMRSQQVDLPGPQLSDAPQLLPPGEGGNPNNTSSYSTTPLTGQQQALRTPLGRSGNGDLRLMYPLPTPEPVTSPFGWRVHPVTGQRRLHTGTDIGAASGTPILAAYSGKVVTADQMGGYGLAVVIEHNDGTQDTLYAHMSEILVRPGQTVPQGAVIGRVGSTGMSTGPHLHFELRQKTADGWQTLDPGPNLQAAKNELVRALQSAQQPEPPQQAN